MLDHEHPLRVAGGGKELQGQSELNVERAVDAEHLFIHENAEKLAVESGREIARARAGMVHGVENPPIAGEESIIGHIASAGGSRKANTDGRIGDHCR